MRQAYDYWQDQPGKHSSSGPPTGELATAVERSRSKPDPARSDSSRSFSTAPTDPTHGQAIRVASPHDRGEPDPHREVQATHRRLELVPGRAPVASRFPPRPEGQCLAPSVDRPRSSHEPQQGTAIPSSTSTTHKDFPSEPTEPALGGCCVILHQIHTAAEPEAASARPSGSSTDRASASQGLNPRSPAGSGEFTV